MTDIPQKIITPEFRASYVHVFQMQENKRDDGSVSKEYSLNAIFPLNADLSALKAGRDAALAKKFGSDQSKWPENLRNPLRKCKERWKNEGGNVVIPPGYEEGEAIFVTFKAWEDSKPSVVDANVEDIKEPKDFYSGCYARASVKPYYYERKGNKGVGFKLGNVQKLRDGEPLGGTSRPTDDFQPVAGAGATGGQGAKGVFDD